MAKKVMKKLKEEVEKKGLKLSVTENGKEGQSKMIASCGFLEDELRQCSEEEGVTIRHCGNDGCRLKNKSQEVGSKRKSEEKEVQSEILSYQQEGSLPENFVKTGAKKILRAGMVPARTWRVHAVGIAPTERDRWQQERAKTVQPLLLLLVEAYGLEVEEDLSTLATQYWAEGVWTAKKVPRTKRSVNEGNSRSSIVEAGERTCRSSDV